MVPRAACSANGVAEALSETGEAAQHEHDGVFRVAGSGRGEEKFAFVVCVCWCSQNIW